MPTHSDYETTDINGVAWIVRIMPDGHRRRVGRQTDLRGMLDGLEADPSLQTREAEQAAIERESAASVRLSIARYGGGDAE
jgi:hypothetical protein